MKAETSRSPNWLVHGNRSVGFVDPGVEFQVTVAICCHLTGQVNKFPHILQLPSVACDWIAGGEILAQDLCLLFVDLETYGTGSLVEFLCPVRRFSLSKQQYP